MRPLGLSRKSLYSDIRESRLLKYDTASYESYFYTPVPD
jgi:hypothetical protein